ncbi:hypothetical protein KKF82_06720 [Patescibacteria group bacterium]|nr:hypothetical protein [Patescibacteria group bacterium]
MITIPLQDIAAAGALLSPFVIVGVQMAKSLGVESSRLKALAAIVLGQVLALAHWAVAWEVVPATLFDAVLVGVTASAIAMGLWTAALKQGVEGAGGAPHGPTT